MIDTSLLVNKKVLLAATNSEICETIVDKLIFAGSKVLVIGDLSINSTHSNLTNFNCNLDDITNLESILRPIIERHKPFDGFVFAYGKGGVRPLSLTKPDFLHEMMRSNFYSFIEIARLLMKKDFMNRESSIVVISSVSSIKGLKSKIAYSASKAALDAAVRAMAVELASKKIRVNSIQKGWVSSDMKLDFIENNRALSENDDFKRQVLGAVEPEEIGEIVVFLLSNTAKSITGTALVIDGGYTIS
jgi:NAD(P)-dependent dehydrogenase (short-subunit alcohol dehydrogenase family)